MPRLHAMSKNFLSWVIHLTINLSLMQVPSNMVLNKIGLPAVYLPTVMIVWGIISGATAGVHNFAGLVAVRFFLGFVEAAYFVSKTCFLVTQELMRSQPGVLFFLSSWYTRKELALRTALMYSGSLISGAFSGLITAGITNGLTVARGLRAWRWMFIIEGAITVVIAFACYFILPNFPRTTKWLTEKERQLAVWRLQEDVGEDDWVSSSDQGFGHGAKLAFTDIKTYILGFLLLGLVSSGSLTNFFPSLSRPFLLLHVLVPSVRRRDVVMLIEACRRYAAIQQNKRHGDPLLSTSQGSNAQLGRRYTWLQYDKHATVDCSTLCARSHYVHAQRLACRSNGRTILARHAANVRSYCSIHPCCCDNIYGSAIRRDDVDGSGRLHGLRRGMSFFSMSSSSSRLTTRQALAWVSNSIPRPPDKRAVALAAINAFSNAAQIYSSFMYKGAPRYSKLSISGPASNSDTLQQSPSVSTARQSY